jgi:hypothetical protein
MPLAAIFVAWALSVFPAGARALSFLPHAQAAPASPQQEKPQDGSVAPAATPAQPDAQSAPPPSSDQSQPAKQTTSPCPETSPPATAGNKDCTPAASNPDTKAPRKASGTSPKKKVVRNGSTTEPAVQIAPSVPGRQASKALRTTDRLLATTDANLKKLSARNLTPAQEATVTQIKNYMEQSRKAADNGDPQRAYNLAHKANLLSTELASP